MGSSRIAFTALGIACVAAAAGGSYVATRHNVAEQAAPGLIAANVAGTQAGNAEQATTSAPARQAGSTASATDARQSLPVASAARPSATTPSGTARSAVKTPEAQTEPKHAAPAQAARVEQPSAAADRSWPATVTPAPGPAAEPPMATRNEERPAEPQRASDAPEPAFDELTVAADSVIGLRTDTTLSSERARIEDRVEARVVRDVRVGARVAIPAGTRVLGNVTVVERGGKVRDRARLGIRFNTLLLPDGTRLPISTETIYRYGDAPGNDSAKKIGGGAVAGAILGAILGGGKGAAIGATTGAAGGGAMVMGGERSEAVFPSGADVTARILSPVTVTLER